MSVKYNVVGGAIVHQSGKLETVVANKGDPGAPGPASTIAGPQGNTGWTPVLAGEADGTRTLIKVADWTGGQGTKPDIGMYIGTTGYVTAKADAFNFNSAKRVRAFSAVTNAQGIATIDYSALGFTTVPSIVCLPATTAVLSGPTMTTLVTTPTASAPTKTTAQLKVQTTALLTGVLTLLAGATANALVIET